MKILLIEDDPGVARSLTRTLAHQGHAVTTFHTAERAIVTLKHKLYDGAPFDAVIADFDLALDVPRRNGADVLRAAREYLPDASRIIYSSREALAAEGELIQAQYRKGKLADLENMISLLKELDK